MTNNTYAWWLAESASVSAGSTVVTINSGEDTSGVFEHDALAVYVSGEIFIAEVRRSLPGQVELVEAWTHPNVSALPIKVIPTAGDFQAATAALKQALDNVEANYQAIEDWGTELGYVTFTGADGVEYTARTMRQMDHDSMRAMNNSRLVDEIRAQNKNQFAASGFVHWGKTWSDWQAINEGLTVPNLPKAGRDNNIIYTGTKESSPSGSSETGHPVIHVAGITTELEFINAQDPNLLNTIKFPEAPDGTVTYDSSTGAVVQHVDAATAFASETTANKVVTNRHDMWGFETFLEEVTEAQPYVYAKGCIQSLASPMNGIPTSDSARPVTYYAVYDGDTTSRGKGVDFFAATEEQRAAMLADASNNLYVLDDGRVVQWRVRQRTIAGAGNGDWRNVDPASPTYTVLQYSGTSFGRPQGDNDVIISFGGYRAVTSPATDYLPEKGLFSSNQITSGIGRECYFLVCGVVPRLNQGAYHPRYNEMGTRRWRDTTSFDWYSLTSRGWTSISQLDCFTSNVPPALGYNSGTGAIGQSSSRPDDRFYDAIYASGQGGVTDMRLSAWDMQANWKETLQKVYAAKYRGKQQLKFTQVFSSAGVVPIGWNIENQDNPDAVVASTSLNESVSGSFTYQDVIGGPANIIQTPELQGGWYGGWCPVLPVGALPHPLTRKALNGGTTLSITFTTDLGSTWTSSESWGFDSVTNTIGSFATGHVGLVHYTAYAHQTEDSGNAAVLGRMDGLDNVMVTHDYRTEIGGLLAESTIGDVLTSTAAVMKINNLSFEPYFGLLSDLGLYPTFQGARNRQGDLFLDAPDNNSPAYKTLPALVEENGQLFIQFQSNELKYDTDWGDDSTVKISVSGKGTFTDLNGNTMVQSCTRTALPIGWVKNKAKAGSSDTPA